MAADELIMARGKRFSVLFLCTHNSARRQIAEAVLRSRAGDRFEAASAGSELLDEVHPLALEIVRGVGGDPGAHRPKGLDDVLGRDWDLVITLWERAREACPALPDRTVSAHWSVPDPSDAHASEEERRNAFREAHKLLTRRIDLSFSLTRAGEHRALRIAGPTAAAERRRRLEPDRDGVSDAYCLDL